MQKSSLRNEMYRFCLPVLVVLACLLCGCSDSDDPVATVETTRDDKGVWFITGTEDATLFNIFEAQGYAVASDRLWQAETFRRTARGRLAEIFGESQVQVDVFMRVTGYSDEELQAGFDGLNEETRTIVQAYVDGFNRRIAEVREDESLLPLEFKSLNFTPEDWSVLDVVAWCAAMLRNFDPEGSPASDSGQLDNAVLFGQLVAKYGQVQGMAMFNDLRWINDPEALTYIPSDGNAAMTSGYQQMSNGFSGSSDLSGTALLSQTGKVPNISRAAENIRELHSSVINSLKEINAYIKMGSYAWVVSGSKTTSGNPVVYSGPQMGFSTPAIIFEGSIRAGELNISGMTVAGLPGILIGRTPHHTWSMQVGHAHTTDYYIEDPADVTLHRVETIKVAGGDDVTLPVYRSAHGPIVNPLPYVPDSYVASAENPIVAWKYAHRDYEFRTIGAYLEIARAASMDEFGQALEDVGVSQHYCYADRDGNIAYWMSGRDPKRTEGEYRFPQGFLPGAPVMEWDAAVLRSRSTDRNNSQGFYAGWNNKSSADYESSMNSRPYSFGPFHRAHVLDEYLKSKDKLTFEEIRDLALNIATTDSFRNGGNPWTFVSEDFSAAVQADPTAARTAALTLMENWDGHFVDGGQADWAEGTDRADAWMLMDAWLREAVRLTFEDELGSEVYGYQNVTILFNAMLHGLAGDDSAIKNNYDWFQNTGDPDAPQTPDAIIVASLDNALAALGEKPWGTGKRGEITFTHDMIGDVHTMPFSSRSTYAHCVEMGPDGPVRIDSMFPLGESGTILPKEDGTPGFDPNFFSMTGVYDTFVYRSFPLFE